MTAAFTWRRRPGLAEPRTGSELGADLWPCVRVVAERPNPGWPPNGVPSSGQQTRFRQTLRPLPRDTRPQDGRGQALTAGPRLERVCPLPRPGCPSSLGRGGQVTSPVCASVSPGTKCPTPGTHLGRAHVEVSASRSSGSRLSSLAAQRRGPLPPFFVSPSFLSIEPSIRSQLSIPKDIYQSKYPPTYPPTKHVLVDVGCLQPPSWGHHRPSG